MSEQTPCPECGYLVFPSRPGSKLSPEEVDEDENYSSHTDVICGVRKKLAMARDMMQGLKILFACTVPLESQWAGLCDSWSRRIAEFEGKPEAESASPCRDCGSPRKAGVLHAASECRDALMVRRDALAAELKAARERMLAGLSMVERAESAMPCRDCGSPRKVGVLHTASECRDAISALTRQMQINQERSSVEAEKTTRTTRHYNHYTPGRSDDFERELTRQAELAKPLDASQQEAARDEAYRAGLTKGFYLAVAHVELSNRGWSYAEKKLEEALKKTPST